MASSSLRVSSLCRTNPSLVNCGIPTPSPPASLHFSTAHNPFRLFSSRPNSIVGPSISFVPSAVATPNSSLLSEEDFKGFGKGSLDVSDSEYEESPEAAGEGELSLSKLRLPQRLVDTLEKRGITELFPIQRAVLMPALRGRDIIARAKTGTGKTLAFGIPIIKGLDDLEQGQVSQRQGRLPKALVLAPTRELAKQVEKEFKESAPSLSTVCIYGGVSYVSQESALSRGIDVVVGTPGRIIDLIKNKSLQLGEVRYLVLDEADQMLAVGFEEDVETIMEKLPAQRQNMLFSATMPIWVKKLARKFMENALTIDLVGDREEKLAEGIKLYAISTTSTSKRTMLSDLVTPRRYWNINLEEMLEAGVHFGHATRKWNPQMAPFISAKRNGIHITNLIKTARFLSEACDLVFDAASKGKQFLIVGTKKKAADLVAWASIKSRSHYVNKKWLGGMLTNWSTTETRLQKFRDLRMEQKTGKIDRLPKRDAAVVKRQLSRLQTYLGGIKYMTGLPDVVIIVDQLEERTAMLECITLGIPTICLVDTNCDPDLADISIPANDDAISSIRFVLNKLLFAISEGHSVMRGEVIHYELPNDPETFVHRSGRTGRAGKEGTAVLMFTGSQRRTVKSLERDVGCQFEFITPPSVEQVLESSAETVVSTLGGVHPESIQYFKPTAQRLMEEQGVDALAAALASLSGFAKPPSSRSLSTHEQGLVTLQLIRESSGYLNARSVTGFLSDVYSTAADEIRKIHLIADEKVVGAVFDLPEEIAKELLTKELPPGNTISKISKLPSLQDDGPAGDFYGRFSNNERRPQRGGSRGGRGSSRSSGDWLNDDDDFEEGFRSRGRGGRGGSSWGNSSRSSGGGSDWLIGGDRRTSRPSFGGRGSSRSSSYGSRDSSRSPSYGGRGSGRSSSFGGGEDRFGGACFNCGQTGHRASDCPTKKQY